MDLTSARTQAFYDVAEPYFSVGPDFKFTYANAAYLDFARTSHSVEGLRLENIHPTTETTKLKEFIQRARASGLKAVENDFSALTQRWLEYRLTPVGDEVRILILDVTDQRDRELQVGADETRWRAILEGSKVGIAQLALDGSWLSVNTRFCEIVGSSVAELEFRSLREMCFQAGCPAVDENWTQLIAGTTDSLVSDRARKWIRRRKKQSVNLETKTGPKLRLARSKKASTPTSVKRIRKSIGARFRSWRSARRPDQVQTDLELKVNAILLERFCSSGVVVTKNMQIVRFKGDTSPYLAPAAGEATLNLFKMARLGLEPELRILLKKAEKTRLATRKENVRLQGRRDTIAIEIIPIIIEEESPCYLVIFDYLNAKRVNPSKPKSAAPLDSTQSKATLRHLREELGSTREHLQAIIREQDLTNEELQAANEEVLSSNEELQSTNEEMETAKEELQSARSAT